MLQTPSQLVRLYSHYVSTPMCMYFRCVCQVCNLVFKDVYQSVNIYVWEPIDEKLLIALYLNRTSETGNRPRHFLHHVPEWHDIIVCSRYGAGLTV